MNLTSYTPAFKEEAVRKALGRGSHSLVEVAAALNVSRNTLKNWLTTASRKSTSAGAGGEKRADDWTAAERLQALLDTQAFWAEDVNAWCRARGLFAYQLTAWKQDFSQGPRAAIDAAERRKFTDQITTLQLELPRKDRALAEAAALLVLQRNTGSSPDRVGRLA